MRNNIIILIAPPLGYLVPMQPTKSQTPASSPVISLATLLALSGLALAGCDPAPQEPILEIELGGSSGKADHIRSQPGILLPTDSAIFVLGMLDNSLDYEPVVHRFVSSQANGLRTLTILFTSNDGSQAGIASAKSGLNGEYLYLEAVYEVDLGATPTLDQNAKVEVAKAVAGRHADTSDLQIGYTLPKEPGQYYVFWSLPNQGIAGLAVYFPEADFGGNQPPYALAYVEENGLTKTGAGNAQECDAMCSPRSEQSGCYSYSACTTDCRPRLHQTTSDQVANFATCMVENPLCYQTGLSCAHW